MRIANPKIVKTRCQKTAAGANSERDGNAAEWHTIGAMDSDFLDILACPVCKGKLEYRAEARQLICRVDRLAFAITDDDIPVLLAEEASPLSDDEL